MFHGGNNRKTEDSGYEEIYGNLWTFGGYGHLGVVSTTMTYLLQTVSQKYVDETKSAIILSMEAVFGTFFSVLLLHENVTVRMLMGSVLIFAAVLVSEVRLKGTKGAVQADGNH